MSNMSTSSTSSTSASTATGTSADALLLPLPRGHRIKEDGQKVVWGNIITHEASHIPPKELEAMRLQKDDLGDDMLEVLLERQPALLAQKGSEVLRIALEVEFRAYQLQIEGMKQGAKEKMEGKDGKFGTSASATATTTSTTTTTTTVDKRTVAFFDSVCTTPSWLSKSILLQGQLTYLRYYTSAALGLTYYSLVGGFSAPKIIAVLDHTGYLTRTARDETWRRLNETFEMVVDVMATDDTLEVDKLGWWSLLKVRMLHSRVRRRIMGPPAAASADLPGVSGDDKMPVSEAGGGADTDSLVFTDALHEPSPPPPPALVSIQSAQSSTSSGKSKSQGKIGRWDIDTYGIPINQEDMMGTLLSFSVNVITAIQKIGSPWLTRAETEAYLHLWRYIGHLIGVKSEYNVCTSQDRAMGAIESVVMHLLHPTTRSKEVSQHVLNSMVNRRFGSIKHGWTLVMHEEMAVSLLGTELGNGLGIAQGPEFASNALLSTERLWIKIILIVMFVLNCIIPLIMNRNTIFGRWCIKRLRYDMRQVVSRVLYPERYDSHYVATTTVTVTTSDAAGDDTVAGAATVARSGGIPLNASSASPPTAAINTLTYPHPTCPFGFGS